jgi:hypothetical protein
MKQILILLFFAATSVQAQTLKAGDAFRQMPDSILPYLTANNRLDMLDFMDSHMKARVQNKFDGYSEMLSLADDSLTIQMSAVMRLTLRMVTSAEEVDGSRQLISLERTISQTSADADGKMQPKTIRYQDFYSVLWRKLDEKSVRLVK